jgi:hypothetical protein
MSLVKLTNSEIEEMFPNAKNLGDIIGAMEQNLLEHDEVLSAILVNGKKLSSEDELIQTNLTVSNIQTIEFESHQVFQLLNDTLQILHVQFAQMIKMSEFTSQLFRGTDQKGAAEAFADLIGSCEQTIDALVQIQILLSNRKIDGVMPEEWASVAMLFQQVITDMVKAYENQDSVTVADYLDTRFPASLQHWSNFVTRIGELAEFGLAKANQLEPQIPHV